MATHTMIEVRCDFCHEAETDWGSTKSEMKSYLRNSGWKIGRLDLCPACAGETEPTTKER